ncbi:MAG: quinolinate synthase NadA [SAR202 cluster bacterium]|nr:quinolinate synthase NadA [SAR202 cluster bacterium]
MTSTKYRPRTIPITEIEQSAFCRSSSNLKSKTLAEELKAGVRWQTVPAEYRTLESDQVVERIQAARSKLGERVMVLGHHYQRDEVIQFADFRGDSYNLSKYAAETKGLEAVIFCGVHFMAETADILTDSDVSVILPNLMAGCSMADMAKIDDVEECWDELTEIYDDEKIIPITYMNSTAAIKSLCGSNGGIVCTSSNATKVFEWAFERGQRVLFLPDQHLGRNTGLKLGIGEDEMVVWSPFKGSGGNSLEQLQKAKVVLWEGHCSVHTRFTVEQIHTAREEHPSVNVIVHPECPQDVLAEADMNGSTELIIKTISEADSGSKWAVGTEISLVNRLAKEHPDKTVFCLDPVVCPCSTMYRIHPTYLLWVLEALNDGVVVNQIKVGLETQQNALIALERMLRVS